PTEKVALRPPVKPDAVALNCLLVPAVVHCTLVQTATPLAAAVPMSKAVNPTRDPEPELSMTETGKFPGKPVVERFANASHDLMTGWVAKIEPTRDTPPGCVLKVSRSAVAGLTTTFSEVT